jgi:hypothetical protein
MQTGLHVVLHSELRARLIVPNTHGASSTQKGAPANLVQTSQKTETSGTGSLHPSAVFVIVVVVFVVFVVFVVVCVCVVVVSVAVKDVIVTVGSVPMAVVVGSSVLCSFVPSVELFLSAHVSQVTGQSRWIAAESDVAKWQCGCSGLQPLSSDFPLQVAVVVVAVKVVVVPVTEKVVTEIVVLVLVAVVVVPVIVVLVVVAVVVVPVTVDVVVVSVVVVPVVVSTHVLHATKHSLSANEVNAPVRPNREHDGSKMAQPSGSDFPLHSDMYVVVVLVCEVAVVTVDVVVVKVTVAVMLLIVKVLVAVVEVADTVVRVRVVRSHAPHFTVQIPFITLGSRAHIDCGKLLQILLSNTPLHVKSMVVVVVVAVKVVSVTVADVTVEAVVSVLIEVEVIVVVEVAVADVNVVATHLLHWIGQSSKIVAASSGKVNSSSGLRLWHTSVFAELQYAWSAIPLHLGVHIPHATGHSLLSTGTLSHSAVPWVFAVLMMEHT